jgi:hypothetical protein
MRFARPGAGVTDVAGYAEQLYEGFREDVFAEALELVRADVRAMVERETVTGSRFDPFRWTTFLVRRLEEQGPQAWMPEYAPDDPATHERVVRRTIGRVAHRIAAEGTRLVQLRAERVPLYADLADVALVDALEAAGTDAARDAPPTEWSGHGLPAPWHVDSPQLLVPMAWNLGVAYLEVATGREDL